MLTIFNLYRLLIALNVHFELISPIYDGYSLLAINIRAPVPCSFRRMSVLHWEA